MVRDSARQRVRRVVRGALGVDTSRAPRSTIPALVSELARSGPAPLASRARPADHPLHIATVIPSFRRGSGGHATIVHLMRRLAARGHTVSLWLDDFELLHARTPPSDTQAHFAAFFGAGDLELQTGFAHWNGADVVLATGWQTVPRVLMLPGAGARAYVVQDHEPEFYATSAESLWAADSYRHGLHCIAASPWLAELLRRRYGASASHFDLALDHSAYRAPDPAAPRENVVAFYARAATPRRAVPLGLAALEELTRLRPDMQIALFGDDSPAYCQFPHTHLGMLDLAGLAALYRRAAVGMVLSLTNPSLIGLEMMACGLPCVELATQPVRATFGTGAPLALAEPTPQGICTTLAALLDDGEQRTRLGTDGAAFVRHRTWEAAAEQVERALDENVLNPTTAAWPRS